jgi:type VI secretion system protein ImpB
MSESLQHKLDRVRRPRVQITYDVETNGAMEKKELPLVIGVLSDLSGHSKKDMPPLASDKRKFVNIDRDNFNAVLSDVNPELNLRVANKLADDGSEMNVNLNFKSMDDFEPGRVAEQVPALRELLKMRQRLQETLNRMDLNPKLEAMLQDVLTNTEKVSALAKELGIDASSESPAKE